MPQIPVNLNSAIETLKEEMPSEEARARASQALSTRRPRASWIPRLALVGGAIGVAMAIILWPRPTLGSPWSVAALQTANVPASHRIERSATGETLMEIWQEGGKMAMTAHDPKTRRVILLMRRNDKQHLSYFNFYPPRPKDRNPNATPAATKGRNDGRSRPYDAANFDLVKTLLDDKNVKVLDQRNVTTPEGERTYYKLRSTLAGHTLDVYAEPQTGRIRKIVSVPNGTIATIEYPATIDPAVFDVNVALASDAVTYDIDEETAQARRTLAAGLGSKGGVTLRLAAMDSSGSLWVLWTGATPEGNLSKPFKVTGVKLGKAYGLPALTTSWKKARVSLPAPGIGVRLGGMARPVLTKAPKTLDISIPTPSGYVLFRQIAYQRINLIYDLSEPMGWSKPDTGHAVRR